eukprot:COSAG06_NODE_9079_length_1992_cov_3.759113_2_plen_230_part_00
MGKRCAAKKFRGSPLVVNAVKSSQPCTNPEACTADRVVTVAQSGAIARWSARLAGCYPEDPARAAVADSVYELGQELCTINPLVNCYVGQDFDRIENHYFGEVLPQALPQLERELERAAAACAAYAPLLPGEAFFASTSASIMNAAAAAAQEEDGAAAGGGAAEGLNLGMDGPTLADFNIFHHLDNAQLLEPDLLQGSPALQRWQEREDYTTIRAREGMAHQGWTVVLR